VGTGGTECFGGQHIGSARAVSLGCLQGSRRKGFRDERVYTLSSSRAWEQAEELMGFLYAGLVGPRGEVRDPLYMQSFHKDSGLDQDFDPCAG
jgi:hypothetical protein